MAAEHFNEETIAAADWQLLDELPPFCEFLPGGEGFEIASIKGEEGEPGAVTGVRWATGGIRYIDMPMASNSVIISGSLAVSDDDSSFEVGQGEGLYTPPNWNGTMTATSPVTMLLFV